MTTGLWVTFKNSMAAFKGENALDTAGLYIEDVTENRVFLPNDADTMDALEEIVDEVLSAKGFQNYSFEVQEA